MQKYIRRKSSWSPFSIFSSKKILSITSSTENSGGSCFIVSINGSFVIILNWFCNIKIEKFVPRFVQTSTYPLKDWRMAKWLIIPLNFIRKTVKRNTEPLILPNRCYAFVVLCPLKLWCVGIVALSLFYLIMPFNLLKIIK